jgi:hypothetical protein
VKVVFDDTASNSDYLALRERCTLKEEINKINSMEQSP